MRAARLPMMLIAVLAYNALIFGGQVMGHAADALLAMNFPVTVYSGDIGRFRWEMGWLACRWLCCSWRSSS